MDTFLRTGIAGGYNPNFNVEDITLMTTRDSLVGRWWKTFNRDRLLAQHSAFCHHYVIMVPPDSLYTVLHREIVNYLCIVYWRTPDWWNLDSFPIGPLLPVTLVFYYYHRYIEFAVHEQAIAFWNSLVELEFAVLYIAQ